MLLQKYYSELIVKLLEDFLCHTTNCLLHNLEQAFVYLCFSWHSLEKDIICNCMLKYYITVSFRQFMTTLNQLV